MRLGQRLTRLEARVERHAPREYPNELLMFCTDEELDRLLVLGSISETRPLTADEQGEVQRLQATLKERRARGGMP
jgi:hypothetical protein